MRFGESYGEACRNCGSTQIVVWPPSSAGHCAQCSDVVHAYTARLDRLAERKLALAREAYYAAEAEKRAAERAERKQARRAAVAEAGRSLVQRCAALGNSGLRRAQATLQRALPHRSRTAHNY
jgi:hypothetical protein